MPGSVTCDNTDIFQEGLRIPWLKLFDGGKPNDAVFAILRANVRVPHVTLGDLRAQLAACHTGERGMHRLIERYGLETFTSGAADLVAYTERLVRAAISAWPDGQEDGRLTLQRSGRVLRRV